MRDISELFTFVFGKVSCRR